MTLRKVYLPSTPIANFMITPKRALEVVIRPVARVSNVLGSTLDAKRAAALAHSGMVKLSV
jgi:hypothetical protein